MKKRLIKTLFALMLVCILSIGLLACNEKTSLVDFEDKEIELTYGSEYRLENIVYTEDGVKFGVNSVVKDSSQNTVNIAGGKFLAVDKGGYVIDYSVEVNGNEYSRTVTVKVINGVAPIITTDLHEVNNKLPSQSGDNKTTSDNVNQVYFTQSYTVPTFTAYDYYDGELDVTVEIYKKEQSENVKCEWTVDTAFVPSEAGEYFVLASAKNSGDVKVEKTVPFKVLKDTPVGEWVIFGNAEGVAEKVNASLYAPTENNFNAVDNSDLKSKFVSQSERATISGEYTGNAVKMRVGATNKGYRFSYDLDNNQFEQLINDFTHVEMYLATNIPQVLEDSARYSMNYGMLSKTNATMPFKFTETLKWNRLLIPIKDFVDIAYGNESLQLFRVYTEKFGTYIANNTDFNIYVGNISLVSIKQLPFEVGESTVSGNVGNNVNFTGATKTVLTNSELASDLTAKNASGGIINGYQGNAVHVKVNTLYIKLNYTATDLTQLKAQGYTHLTFNLAFGGSGNYKYNRYVWEGLLHDQFTSDANTPYKLRTDFGGGPSSGDDGHYVFKSLDVEIDTVIANMTDDVIYMGKYQNSSKAGPFDLDTYVGDITLTKK